MPKIPKKKSMANLANVKTHCKDWSKHKMFSMLKRQFSTLIHSPSIGKARGDSV